MNPVEMVALLRHPDARALAITVGYSPGVETDPADLADRLAEVGYYVTEDLAAAANMHGFNLRCNRCGSWGATWYRHDPDSAGLRLSRALALCPRHRQELVDEYSRHAAALTRLLRVDFEQPRRS